MTTIKIYETRFGSGATHFFFDPVYGATSQTTITEGLFSGSALGDLGRKLAAPVDELEKSLHLVSYNRDRIEYVVERELEVPADVPENLADARSRVRRAAEPFDVATS